MKFENAMAYKVVIDLIDLALTSGEFVSFFLLDLYLGPLSSVWCHGTRRYDKGRLDRQPRQGFWWGWRQSSLYTGYLHWNGQVKVICTTLQITNNILYITCQMQVKFILNLIPSCNSLWVSCHPHAFSKYQVIS